MSRGELAQIRRWHSSATSLNFDLAKYQATLLSDTIQYRSDLGGVLEETMKYALANNESRIDLLLHFRNNHFSKYQLSIDEGAPIYTQLQATNILAATRALVERYQTYTGDAYIQDMSNLMKQTNATLMEPV